MDIYFLQKTVRNARFIVIIITIFFVIIIVITRNDLWLSELKPDYYYFEAQTKKFKHGYS